MQILVVVAMILTGLFGSLTHAALKTEVEHVSVGTAVVYGSVDPKPKVKHWFIAVLKYVENRLLINLFINKQFRQEGEREIWWTFQNRAPQGDKCETGKFPTR